MEEQKIDLKSNLELHKDENYLVVSLNPRIYSLDVIYSAAYIFMDKAYLIISGDPEKEIIVEMRPKDENIELEKLGYEFNNEIINYSVYKTQTEKNKDIRNAIVQRALLTNDIPDKDMQDNDESYIDDPEGIAVPWEEKYGNKKHETKTEDIEVPWKELEKDSDEINGNGQAKQKDKDKV
jgi:His-Xaa-Ser system protein HxsD